MEISSNNPLIISQTRQPQGRADEAASFKPQQAEQQKQENQGELLSAAQPEEKESAQFDYRQLVLQARRQQAEGSRQNQSENEAYRVGNEPLKVQQALGAYRDNAEMEDGRAELMPRVDGFA